MKCRLLVNTIIDGRFIPRDSIIDDAILTERLKIPTVVAYDLEDRGGKVMALHDIAFQSLPAKDSSGVPTSYPVHVMAGSVFEIERIPPAHRASFVEGQDYRRTWTEEEQKELLKVGEETYAQQFESPMPAGGSR